MDWTNQESLKCRTWTQRDWISVEFTHIFRLGESLQQVFAKELSDTAHALKHDRTTTVIKINAHQQALVLKRYNARTAWHRLTRAVRLSRAARCWRMSYRFQHAGLHVAQPIMMQETRFGPFRGDAFFISTFIQGNELLTQFPTMTEPDQSKVVAAVQEAFGRMQAHRITHGDMKSSNLIWHNNTLFFIDLDAARVHQSKYAWQKAHQKDRRRFLKNWRDQPKLLALFS